MNTTATRFSDIIINSVKPATGCTEPGAVALAAAAAGVMVNEQVQKIEVEVDINLYKNGADVYIPGTDLRGLDYAAALGVSGGDPGKGLDVLLHLQETSVEAAKYYVRAGKVDVAWRSTGGRLVVRCRIITADAVYLSLILDKHDNLVYSGIEVSGYEMETLRYEKKHTHRSLAGARLQDFIDYVAGAPEDVLDLANLAIGMNKNIAQRGLQNPSNPACSLHDGVSGGYSYPAILTFAGVYERMSGSPVSVMSLAGSGNQGLSAVLPVIGAAQTFHINEARLTESILLCFLIVLSCKAPLGLLSPVCSAASVSCAAASGAIVHLLGGSTCDIANAVQNTLASTAGMLCDGAKNNCALKVYTGVQAAVQNARLAMAGIDVSGNSGILGDNMHESYDNYGLLVDRAGEILDATMVELIQKKRGDVG